MTTIPSMPDPSDRGPRLPRTHFAGTESLPLMDLPYRTLMQTAVRAQLQIGGAVAIEGPFGTGKTSSVSSLCAQLDTEVIYYTAPIRPGRKQAQVDLLECLEGTRPHPRTPAWELDHRLEKSLRNRSCVVVGDDVHRMDREALEQVNYLHCLPDSRFTLVLIGESVADRMSPESSLASHIAEWVRVRPLDAHLTLQVLIGIWSPLAGIDARLLQRIGTWSGGNLRAIARFVAALRGFVADERAESITEQKVEMVLSMVTVPGTQPRDDR